MTSQTISSRVAALMLGAALMPACSDAETAATDSELATSDLTDSSRKPFTIVGPTGKCISAAAGNPTNGSLVETWDCDGSTRQQWTFTSGLGLYNVAARKCLDIPGTNAGKYENGTAITLWDCWGGTNQRWRFHRGQLENAIRGEWSTCVDDYDDLLEAEMPTSKPSIVDVVSRFGTKE